MRNYDLYSKNVFYKSMCYKTQRPNSATIFSCLVILHTKSLTRSYLDCTLGIWPLFVVVSEVIFSSPATKSINITAAVPFSRVPIRWRNFSCSCCCRRPHWSPCCGQPRLDTSVILHSFCQQGTPRTSGRPDNPEIFEIWQAPKMKRKRRPFHFVENLIFELVSLVGPVSGRPSDIAEVCRSSIISRRNFNSL